MEPVFPIHRVVTKCCFPQAFAQLFLDGTQYVYYAEIFPNHLRSKGMSIGIGAISLMNIMWLQAAPTAFAYVFFALHIHNRTRSAN